MKAVLQQQTLVKAFYNLEIFKDAISAESLREIEKIEENRPSLNIEREEKTTFLEKVYGLWLSALGLSEESTMFSKQDSQALANYFYVCELMIRCKESAMRVSPDVWAELESRMLYLT